MNVLRFFKIMAVACILFGNGQQLYSQEKLGIGFIVGTPTAISTQIRYPSENSLDFLLAWEFNNWAFVQSHYDYTIETLESTPDYEIRVYAGPGLFLETERRHRSIAGFSGNIGVAWTFARHFELFTEFSPKISIVPSTDLGLTGGFGFRYAL